MKKYTTTIALLLTLGVFAFLTHSTSEAQEISGLERLATSIDRAVDAFINNKEKEAEESIALQSNIEYEAPACLDEFWKLPTSDKYTSDSDWNINKLKFAAESANYTSRMEAFIDINGDGLLDNIYDYKFVMNSYTLANGKRFFNRDSCVFLNNGRGWDLVYVCKVGSKTIDDQKYPVFYGDCADMTP